MLTAAQGGAPWAFERLYGDLAPAVTAYLRWQGAAEPEDLTSEVFINVFSGLTSFRGPEPKFRSWVFTIAHRRLIDERRRLTRRHVESTDRPELLDHRGGDVEEEAFDVLGERRVHQLCANLSPDQREVLLLRVVGDLTVPQIAKLLGRSAGAVKALQRRGLTAMREKLAHEGVPL